MDRPIVLRASAVATSAFPCIVLILTDESDRKVLSAGSGNIRERGSFEPSGVVRIFQSGERHLFPLSVFGVESAFVDRGICGVSGGYRGSVCGTRNGECRLFECGKFIKRRTVSGGYLRDGCIDAAGIGRSGAIIGCLAERRTFSSTHTETCPRGGAFFFRESYLRTVLQDIGNTGVAERTDKLCLSNLVVSCRIAARAVNLDVAGAVIIAFATGLTRGAVILTEIDLSAGAGGSCGTGSALLGACDGS